jgi:uncharacterized protein (DUF302 family)
MKSVLFCLASFVSLLWPLVSAQSEMLTIEGLVSVKSPYGVTETIDRIAQTVEAKGFTIIARVDHAAAASKVAMELAPTELLIFGNPKGGTPLMQCQQVLGLELPLKVLAWEQASGDVLLSYTDPQFLATRYKASCDDVVTNIITALQGIVQEALAQ